jgi:hypothetical protein
MRSSGGGGRHRAEPSLRCEIVGNIRRDGFCDQDRWRGLVGAATGEASVPARVQALDKQRGCGRRAEAHTRSGQIFEVKNWNL